MNKIFIAAILTLISIMGMKYVNASNVLNNIGIINTTSQKKAKSLQETLKETIESKNLNKNDFVFLDLRDSDEIKKNTINFFNAFNAAFNCYNEMIISLYPKSQTNKIIILRKMQNEYLNKAYKIVDDKEQRVDLQAIISKKNEYYTVIAKIINKFLDPIFGQYFFLDTTILDKLLDHKILINSDTIIGITSQLYGLGLCYQKNNRNKAHLDKIIDYLKKFFDNSSCLEIPLALSDKTYSQKIDNISPSLTSELINIIAEKRKKFVTDIISYINNNDITGLQEFLILYPENLDLFYMNHKVEFEKYLDLRFINEISYTAYLYTDNPYMDMGPADRLKNSENSNSILAKVIGYILDKNKDIIKGKYLQGNDKIWEENDFMIEPIKRNRNSLDKNYEENYDEPSHKKNKPNN